MAQSYLPTAACYCTSSCSLHTSNAHCHYTRYVMAFYASTGTRPQISHQSSLSTGLTMSHKRRIPYHHVAKLNKNPSKWYNNNSAQCYNSLQHYSKASAETEGIRLASKHNHSTTQSYNLPDDFADIAQSLWGSSSFPSTPFSPPLYVFF